MDGFSKYHFKDVSEGEEIIAVIHRNWFYLLEQFFLIFLTLGLFIGAVVYAPTLFPDMFVGQMRFIVPFFENTFFLALWIFGFLIWVDYYFDIWIITSERVINIEQKGLFMRRVSELTYNKVQDVTTQVNGMIPTMLDFGDIRIQTAGENEEFVFRTISDPYRIKSLIMTQIQKSEKRSTNELGEMIKEKIGA